LLEESHSETSMWVIPVPRQRRRNVYELKHFSVWLFGTDSCGFT